MSVTHHHADPDDRRLRTALAITAAFMVVEFAGGLLSGSLALLADAGHMATDVLALGMAWWAARKSGAPADTKHTYGHRRQRVLAAFVNGLALFVVSAGILVEAIRRLVHPPQVLGGIMLGVAIAGLLANVVTLAVLHHGEQDLNLRAAAAHVLSDLLGSVAAVCAAIVILASGWYPVDPILSIGVAALILYTGLRFVRETWHVLLESAPPDFDTGQLREELPRAVPGIAGVHHVHAWVLSPDSPCLLTMHAKLEADADADAALRGVREFVHARFGVDHVTVQLERDYCTDNAAPPRRQASAGPAGRH